MVEKGSLTCAYPLDRSILERVACLFSLCLGVLAEFMRICTQHVLGIQRRDPLLTPSVGCGKGKEEKGSMGEAYPEGKELTFLGRHSL